MDRHLPSLGTGTLWLGGDGVWAWPALVLTLASILFVWLFIPPGSGVGIALGLLPLWMAAAAGMLGVFAFWSTVRMMIDGVERPARHIAAFALGHWRRLALIALFMLLAGVNMIAFMWAKPLLNLLFPFRADQLLAAVDYQLFAGHDPWTLLQWMNTDAAAIFYHRGWFALMILTLLLVLMQPPSREKSAIMLTYFLLWSVAGPMVHAVLPAGGPIFYQQLGYGDRFAAIASPASVAEASAYLWRIFQVHGFGAGAGISAMPSLHIATTVWIVIAVLLFARRWLWLVVPMALAIFLLSVSLGWHYAVDGIIGMLLAAAIYAATYRWCPPAARSQRLQAATPQLTRG